MKIPFFASIIVFCIWLAYEIRKNNKKNKKAMQSFWEKEKLADSTRKKSLDDLNYIVLPPEILHLFDENIPEEIQDAAEYLLNSVNLQIVNLSFITNTDLKLRYGAANLETLSSYDANFTNLLKNLNTVGEYYFLQKDTKKALLVLEYAVSIQSDLISTYRMLASLYSENGNTAGIDYLINSASILPGLTRKPILHLLQDLRPADTNEKESILDILD